MNDVFDLVRGRNIDPDLGPALGALVLDDLDGQRDILRRGCASLSIILRLVRIFLALARDRFATRSSRKAWMRGEVSLANFSRPMRREHTAIRPVSIQPRLQHQREI